MTTGDGRTAIGNGTSERFGRPPRSSVVVTAAEWAAIDAELVPARPWAMRILRDAHLDRV